MILWLQWWSLVRELRPAFSRTRTFLWFTLALAALCVRTDRLGVTSLVRALGLKADCYDRLLDCFHSPSLNLDRLTRLWVSTVLTVLRPFLLIVNGRLVLLADGIKVAKTGRKMPGVKRLRANSDTKPRFIFGHSCQALTLVARYTSSFLAIPLACRIHEGIKRSSNDTKTQFDKLIELLDSIALCRSLYLVADSYYSNSKIIKPLLKKGQHLITAVRLNAVAYELPKPPFDVRVGRRLKYGDYLQLKRFFRKPRLFTEAPSPIYGEKNVMLRYRVLDLCWKSVGQLVRFVLVIHPTRGKKILLSTDRSLTPLQIIELFGVRFKIEACFKQAVHTVGAYAYHFWVKAKRGTRDHLNHVLANKPESYQRQVYRKMHAYHVFIQAGFIAQGLLQVLALTQTVLVWRHFGSWIRTIRPEVAPSEFVTICALRHTLPAFLSNETADPILLKFLTDHIDPNRSEGLLTAA